jgi:hypothetical protein
VSRLARVSALERFREVADDLLGKRSWSVENAARIAMWLPPERGSTSLASAIDRSGEEVRPIHQPPSVAAVLCEATDS